jgi:prepilin-type N-terminal cleavage/methylation domain-containing protein
MPLGGDAAACGCFARDSPLARPGRGGGSANPLTERSLRSTGFTLIEFVVVMVILSIIAATAALHISAQGSHAVVVAADELRRNLSHVQALALGWGARLRITVSADGASYSVTCRTALARLPCVAVGDIALDPATGQNFAVTLASGVALSPASSVFDIDSLGRPVDDAGLLSANPAMTYSFSGGGRTAAVAVQPITGLALASY